jgi:hypothetical protein
VRHQEGAREQRDGHAKVEIQSKSELQSLTSSQSRSPGPHCLQIDAHDTHDLRFRCSSYVWKDKEIRFPMQLVSWSSKIGVTCNHRNKIISRTFLPVSDRSYQGQTCASRDRAFKLMHMKRMTYNLDVLHMNGKIVR